MLGNPATKAHQVLNNNCNTQTVHVQSAINVQVCIKTCTVPYMSMQCILVLSLHSLAHSLPGISICCWLGGSVLEMTMTIMRTMMQMMIFNRLLIDTFKSGGGQSPCQLPIKNGTNRTSRKSPWREASEFFLLINKS